MTNSTFRRTLLMTSASVAVLLASTGARCEDFTFTVPVDIRNLGSFPTHLAVRCEALTAPPPSGIRLAAGSASVPVANGAYQGPPIVVRFNAPQVLEKVKGYRCQLVYIGADGREVLAVGLPHKAGTTFTTEVGGAINP